jgi:hypothetical protein
VSGYVLSDPELTPDVDDTVDVSDLLRDPAGNATAQEFGPPIPPWMPAYDARSEPDPLDDADGEGEVRPAITTVSEAALVVVLEAAVFKSELHPRWPKGTPEKAGQFMHVGQTFQAGGKTWQIAHIVKGHVVAHEASANYKSVETRTFDVKHIGGEEHPTIPGATYKPPVVPLGGKSQSSQVPIVSPYVEPQTHDPSIPIPADSGIEPEQWKRFGRVDQLHYAELQDRFGKHKPGAAKQHVDAAYSAYQAKVQQMVKKGYQQQYGSSSGFSLSLAAGKHGHGIPQTPEYAKLREEALALQAEHRAAVQWDLYNRTHSPDVFAVHKSSDHAANWNNQYINGDKAIFSGLSQSWNYRQHFFGSHGIATPLAIRHVLLATQSAQPVPGESHFPGEVEISVPEQLKLDHRSLAFDVPGAGAHALTPVQNKWLEGITNQPVGGSETLDMLRDSIQSGAKLPTPPQPAHLVMDGQGGQTWADPPAAAAKVLDAAQLPKVQGSNIDPASLNKDLPWAHVSDAGVPEAQTGETAGAKAGQYFMGLKGTLYWIGNDPGNTSGYPFRIHKIEGGAFNGENFAYNPSLPGYYLDAHHEEVLPKAEDAPEFDASKWAPGVEQQFLEDFQQGDKFKLNGTAYEVTGPMSGAGTLPVMDLESGKTGKINGDYKSVKLVPLGSAAAASPVEGPKLSVGSEVLTDDGHGSIAAIDGGIATVDMTAGGYQVELPVAQLAAWGAHQDPVVGMTLPVRKPGTDPGAPKSKAVITQVKINGDVVVNFKPGKHVIPKDEWPAYAAGAFDPSAHTITDTPVKLRDMQPGDRFQGGAGSQTLRPYEVLSVPAAGKVTVRNMDTGQVSQMSRHVGYRPIVAKPALGSAAEGSADLSDSPSVSASTPQSTDIAEHFNPADWAVSPTPFPLKELPVGTFVKGNGPEGKTFYIAGKDADGTVHLQNVGSGEDPVAMEPELIARAMVHPYFPKGATPKPQTDLTVDPPEEPVKPVVQLDAGKFVEGELTKLGDMAPGTVFKTASKGGEKFYKISDDGQHSVALHNGKAFPLKGHWKGTVMHPAEEPGGGGFRELEPGSFSMDDWENAGSSQPLEDLPVGAVFTNAGGNSAWQKLSDGEARLLHSDISGATVGATVPVNGTVFPLRHSAGVPSVPEPSEPGEPAHKVGDTVTITVPGPKQGVPAKVEAVHFEGGQHWYMVKPDGWTSSTYTGDELQALDGKTDPTPEPVVGSGLVKASSLKGKPGALFTHQGVTYSVAADQSATGSNGMQAIGPDGKTHMIGDFEGAGGVVPQPGKGAAAAFSDGDSAVYQGQKITVSSHVPSQAGIDGAVSVTLPDGSTQTVNGAQLTHLPDPSPGDKVQAVGTSGAVYKGYVKQVIPGSGDVMLHGSNLTFAPQQVTVLKSYPFQPGDDVETPDGKVGKLLSFHSIDEGGVQAAVDLTGNLDVEHYGPDSLKLATAPAPEPVGVPLTPKADAGPLPADSVHAGDVTTVGKLEAGDQFTTPMGKFELVQPPTSSQDYAKVAWVNADGELGALMNLQPGAPVTIHAKAADAAKVPPPVEHTADWEGLPDAVDHGFVGFKSHKGSGGKWSHHMVKTMPEGTIFADLTGKQWKVKQAGAQPVITDGVQHFKVSGQLRGKDLNQPAVKQSASLVDSSPPLGWQPDGPTLVPASGLTVADLQPGDLYRVSPGAPVYEVASKTGLGGAHSLAVGEDFSVLHPAGMKPHQVSVNAGKVALAAPAPTSAPTPEAASHLFTSPAAAGELKVGQQFALSPGGTTTYEVTGNAPGGSKLYKPVGVPQAASLALGSSDVYVEPGAPDSAPGPQMLPTTKLIGVGPHPAKMWADFAVGDRAVFNYGSTYTVVGKEQQGPWTYLALQDEKGKVWPPRKHKHDTLMGWAPPQPQQEQSQPIDPAAVTDIATPEQFGPPANVPADPVVKPTPAPSTEQAVPGALQPFASRLGPGGVYRHDRLSELQPGQLFTDKTGQDYKLVAHGEGSSTFQHLASGDTFSSPNGVRVKRTALPPNPGVGVSNALKSIEAKYGSLDAVPTSNPPGFQSATGENGKVKYPRLGHLKIGDGVEDAAGNFWTVVASWLDKTLAIDGEGEYRIVPAATRVRRVADPLPQAA